MKTVGYKIEGSRKPYIRYSNPYYINQGINELLETLGEEMAIEIKVGNNHYYIDKGDEYHIDDVMYRVKEYLKY